MANPSTIITRDWKGPRAPISVVILTLDEEVNIAACLASCSWSDDVHVLDSGSKDATVELAQVAGATTHFNRFESFGAQRNWAIDHIPLRHDWVFHLDADERFTPRLVEELAAVLGGGHAGGGGPHEAGFHVANQMILHGTWIKRSSGYPAYQMRFFHKERMRFVDHGHGQREAPGMRLGTLREPYVHLNFSKGLEDWIDRHNRYSTREARHMLADHADGGRLRGLFSRDRLVRRRSLKSLAAKVPCRPQLRWLYTVLVQGAWLDGRSGFTYASLLSMYERMIQMKLRELRSPSPHARRLP
jgi:glycosyltransferase involved in cell wall biosynthesis